LKRSSGVLLHITSLPSRWGVGDLGPSASRFAELLQLGGQSWWQILPLPPVEAHGSPYSARSLFAGNPLLLSPEKLVADGFLAELPPSVADADPRLVNYAEALAFKTQVIESAYRHSYGRVSRGAEFLEFCARNASWLDDFALYEAIREAQGRPWYDWPEEIRRREPSALEIKRSKLGPSIEKTRFGQYLFEKQWSALVMECKERGIQFLGDVPFYVFHDSADIWAHKEFFKVDSYGRPVFVGGVPPDLFSETGQRWGNPVYDWSRLEERGYDWYNEKLSRSLHFAPLVRLDHFRGYVAYWEIPAEEKTAIGGKWVEVPKSFFPDLKSSFPMLPFVAEDLGVITDDVKEAKDDLGIPGMKVLEFAFDGSKDNPYLPENHEENSLVCTGTHDTNTALGWFRDETGTKGKDALSEYLGRPVTERSVCAELIAMAMTSVSGLAVIPMQDILRLGSEARMNNPGKSEGNWRWRALPEEISEGTFRTLHEDTTRGRRC